MCWLQQSAQLWHLPAFLLPPLLIIAWIECVAGYHAWRLLLGLNGGVLGLVVGVIAGAWTGNAMLMVVIGLAGSTAGALLFTGLEALGSFVFAMGTGASLVLVSASTIGLPPAWRLPLAAIAGVGSVIGVLSAWRPVIIGLTAVAGAQQIAGAWHAYHLWALLAPSSDVPELEEWLIFLVLAVTGVVVQVCTSRPKWSSRKAAALRGQVHAAQSQRA